VKQRCGQTLGCAQAATLFLALGVLGSMGCANGGGAGAIIDGVDPSTGVDAGSDADSDSEEDYVPPDGGGLPEPPPRDPNDEDGDGSRGGVDCNDRDETIHPGAPEVCDGKDNDCDGFADTFAIDATTYYPDEDEDGVGNPLTPVRSCQQPVGWVVDGGDCDDNDPNVGIEDLCSIEQLPVIYVAHHGNDDNSGEAPMEAVRTIKVGIARALACPEYRCSVLIASGTYEESVAVADGVSLFGGYSQDFMARDETAHEVIISSAEDRTVTAANLTLPTRLDRLTIRGAILGGDDGRSSYAVWVRDSIDKLTLSRLHIVAGRGANGARGADGIPTFCEARGGAGGESGDCTSSTGADGDAGGDPVRGGKGQGGGNNYCASACPAVNGDGVSAGHDGEAGQGGDNGAGGNPAASSLGSFAEGVFVGALGEPGKRGNNGTGGGGGGSGGTKRIRACFGCGTLYGGHGGDGAPGGCGGGGGASGAPGGGAFALALINSKIVLDTAKLEGGEGGKGGGGGGGITGSPGSQIVNTNRTLHQSSKCGLINYWSADGGLGGVGGGGGTGGGGAGGTGGPAVTVAIVGTSSISEAGTIDVTAGIGGQPGEGGPSPALSGNTGLAGEALTMHTY
jgi:hypothetical protein